MTTLDEIQARISDCRTYNFGMYNADKLAHEDAPKMVAALRAVESVHQKAPVHDTWASDCGHDDCDSVEADDGETYCPRSVAAYTCEHCADLSRDNMNGELPDWPCPTIRAIRGALS